MIVRDLKLREIFSHNLKRTIELEIEISKGKVRASVPIGTSRGKHETIYLEIPQVIKNFLEIKKEFEMKDFSSLEEVDNKLKELDGTKNFSKIGGNLSLAFSLAFLKAFSLYEEMEPFEYLAEITKNKISIPRPVCNVIGGGKHGGKVDFQEFLLIDLHVKNFKSSIEKIANAYYEISNILAKEDPSFTFGRNMESAWTTNLPLEKILVILKDIKKKYKVELGIDFAASSLWNGEFYIYKKTGEKLSRVEQLMFIHELAEENGIFYLEDPFDEDDFVTFAALHTRLPKKLIVGDDLYCTNKERLMKGIEMKATNGIIIKPNQVGTISDVIEVVKIAKKHNIKTIVSHRSGETEDPILAHIAVGLNSEFIKLGIAGERTVKINELIRIEEKIFK